MMPDLLSLIGNPTMMKVDFQGSQSMKSVREGKKDRFNEIFTETNRKMKAKSNVTDQDKNEGRVDMSGANSSVTEASKKTDATMDEAKGAIEKYSLEKLFNQEGAMKTMESDLLSKINRLELGESLMALSNVGENQPLTPSSSLLESMATLGLAARNEGVTLTNTGVQSSLPILEHEIIEQVAQKLSVQKLNLNGKESVTLELEPKELGALKIEISVHKGSITAEILTQHPIVKEILEKNLYLLHDGLKQSGFNIDQFSVNVGDFRNQSDSKWNQETFHFSDRQASNYSADPVLAVAGGMGSSSFFGGSEVSLYI